MLQYNTSNFLNISSDIFFDLHISKYISYRKKSYELKKINIQYFILNHSEWKLLQHLYLLNIISTKSVASLYITSFSFKFEYYDCYQLRLAFTEIKLLLYISV